MTIAIVQEVARKLGGQPVLGSVVRSQADLALAVRNRLPLAALKGLTRAGLSEQEIEKYVIPQRTRRHRADKNQPLTVEESDRAVRLLRVQTLAEDSLGRNQSGSPISTSTGWISLISTRSSSILLSSCKPSETVIAQSA